MGRSPQVKFSVHYRLWEYLTFVTEHSFETDEALRDTRGIKRLLAELLQRFLASLAFFYKTGRLGQCDFVISSAGLSRQTKIGMSSIPWSSVRAVHTYSPGYLVELDQGAVPIPFRVLSEQQRALFHTFASDKLVA